jgi:hypothetical protein
MRFHLMLAVGLTSPPTHYVMGLMKFVAKRPRVESEPLLAFCSFLLLLLAAWLFGCLLACFAFCSSTAACVLR